MDTELRGPRTVLDFQHTRMIDDRSCCVCFGRWWAAPRMLGDPKAPQGLMDAELSWALDAGFLSAQASCDPEGCGPRKLQEDSWAQKLRGLHTLVDRTRDACGREGAPRNRGCGGCVGIRSKNLRTLKLRGLQTLMDIQRAPKTCGR